MPCAKTVGRMRSWCASWRSIFMSRDRASPSCVEQRPAGRLLRYNETMKRRAQQIYLDHNATTPTEAEVIRAMKLFEAARYGNPGSFHSMGKEAKDAVDAARQWIAQWMGAREDEVIFTGSGTESDNLAILGYARAHALVGKHMVTTAIEHHAVLEPMQFLARKEGFELTIVPV